MLIRALHAGEWVEFRNRYGEVLGRVTVIKTQTGRSVLGLDAPREIVFVRGGDDHQGNERGEGGHAAPSRVQ